MPNLAAVAVRLAVVDANGDVHDVPIVPDVALTLSVPAVTTSPAAVTTRGALLAVRLYVAPALLS